MTSSSPRHEGRAGPSSISTFTMTCGCSVMPPWRRMSRTRARWCCGAGTRRTSTSSPPAAGSPTTLRRSGTSTRSGDVAAAQPQPLRLPAAPSLRPQDSRRPAPCSRDVTGPAQPLPLVLCLPPFSFTTEIHTSELEHLLCILF